MDTFREGLTILKEVNELLKARGRKTTFLGFDAIWFYQDFLFARILEKLQGQPSPRRAFKPFGRLACLLVAVKSVANALVFRRHRRRLAFYSIGKFDAPKPWVDRRSEDLERYVTGEGYRPFYVLRYFGWREALRSFHRWDVCFPEALFWLLEGLPQWAAVGLSPGPRFTRDDKERLVDHYLRLCERTWYRAPVLRALLKWIAVEAVVMLDDSRYTGELIAAAKSLRLRTSFLMHGRQNEYHVGLMAYGCRDEQTIAVDGYFVWSEYFRSVVLTHSQLYTRDNTHVCGHPRLRQRPYGSRRSGSPVVLFLCEQNVPPAEARPYLEALVSTSYDVVVRLRPGMPIPTELHDVVARHPQRLRMDTLPDVFDALAAADVVVGNHSTVLLESWIVRVPPVKILTSYTYADSLVTDGVALACAAPRELTQVIGRALAMSDLEREAIAHRIWGELASCNLRPFLPTSAAELRVA